MPENFYSKIEPFNTFQAVFDPRNHHTVPSDWYVILSDVKNSTEAVDHGKYKDVNIVGASCIIAVLNVVGTEDIPYVFGGDGASFLVPAYLLEKVSIALLDTRDMAREIFTLDLRIGAVKVEDIRKAGKELLISKYKISDAIHIAMFHGGGLSYADELIKSEKPYELESLSGDIKHEKANFSGLECRWDPVLARKDHIITLMVSSRRNDSIYEDVMRKIEEIYGETNDFKPVKSDNISLANNPVSLKQEFGVQTYKKAPFGKFAYMFKLCVETLIGKMVFALDISVGGVEGKKYLNDVMLNSDFRKFDDTLRIIIDSRQNQTETLLSYLDEGYLDGALYYGVNISPSALMTCLIFERQSKHVHFIDGTVGGYTMAAKNMKKQIQHHTKQNLS